MAKNKPLPKLGETPQQFYLNFPFSDHKKIPVQVIGWGKPEVKVVTENNPELATEILTYFPNTESHFYHVILVFHENTGKSSLRKNRNTPIQSWYLTAE